MKYLEKLLDCVEKAHVSIARWCVKTCTFVWRRQSRRSLALRFAVGFVGMAFLLLFCTWLLDGGYVGHQGWDEVLQRYLEKEGHLVAGRNLSYACLGAAALSALVAGLAVFRKPIVFRLMQGAWALGAVLLWQAFRWTVRAPDILNLADHKAFDTLARNDLWAVSFFGVFFASFWPIVLLVAILSVAARRHYGLKTRPFGGARDIGGDVITSLKTGGKDPRWRSSVYWAVFIFLVILIAPYLSFWWWTETYGLPQGGGEMVQQEVKVKKIKKKKQKKLMVNPWSPYILERMNIDDVQTLNELEEESRDTYQATASSAGGGKGKGSGGWPKGIGGNIRFIRLKYRGGDWDQDMGKGADYNLLIKFKQWTGMKIAKDTEFREIEGLKHFAHKLSPPFVFLTGMGGISVSDKEAKIMRDYCLVEGGMLFIDNGGGYFDGSVKSLLRKVFPGRSLVDIPNDDPIYQRPYIFPDGAPPFWHHAGYRAKGIRDEGRWVVFYHPGDVNDAWKDDHSGASAEVADQAYKLGVNVMFYAFNQYYRRWYEQD